MWAALRADPRVIGILATVVVVDTVFRQMLTPLPLLLRDLGQAPLVYGLLIAGSAALIVLVEAPLAVVLRHRGALAVIATGYALVGLGYTVIGFTPPGLVVAFAAVAMLVVTVGEMLYKPTATAHVADSAPAGMTARYQSLYAAASLGGMLLAPVLGGWAYERWPTLMWPVCGILAGGAAVVLLLVSRRTPHPSAPAEHELAPLVS